MIDINAQCFMGGPWGKGRGGDSGCSSTDITGAGGYGSERSGKGGGYGSERRGFQGGRDSSGYGDEHEGRGASGGYGRERSGGKGGRGGPGDLLRDKLQNKNNAQILFVGSVNCLRHKPYLGIGEIMKEGKASILCPTMSDFSSGRYINQIEEAIVELSEERNCKEFVLICGCQWVILSTDGELICERLKNEHDINVTISVDDHLEFGDHE